jgi:hypothetical protein
MSTIFGTHAATATHDGFKDTRRRYRHIAKNDQLVLQEVPAVPDLLALQLAGLDGKMLSLARTWGYTTLHR